MMRDDTAQTPDAFLGIHVTAQMCGGQQGEPFPKQCEEERALQWSRINPSLVHGEVMGMAEPRRD